MSEKNLIWYLIARSLSNEASPEEWEALQRLLEEDENLRVQYELLKQCWTNKELIDYNTGEEEEKDRLKRILFLANTADDNLREEIEPVLEKKRTPAKVIKIILYAVVAACFVLFILKSPFASHSNKLPKVSLPMQEVATQKGTRTRTILPDGSIVWLNSGSKISYNEDFKGTTREVTLEGEAYFDVAKSSRKPFIVHVSNINIHVLGTAFNVKSYASDSATETTLVSGLVQITGNKGDNTGASKLILHPNEKASISKTINSPLFSDTATLKQEASPVVISKVDTSLKAEDRTEVAWVYNRLVFRGESFKTLAMKMEHWYNIKIVFTDEKVSQLSFYGSFENESIPEALMALKTAIPFNYTIQDHEVYISSAN